MNKLKYFLVSLAFISLTGCYKYQQVPIHQHFWVPDAFTPNGDFMNETFYIRPVYGIDIKGYKLSIFDQNLQTLYTTDDIYDQWDGKYKGIPMPEGFYEFQILYSASEDSVNYDFYSTKSSVNLIR